MSRNCHSPVSASHFSIQESEIIQEQSNGYLVVFKCVKCRSLMLSGCKEPPGAGCAAPGERHFYLPGSPTPPHHHHHHHRLFCTTLHPNAPCPTRRFVGSAFPPDSPLFTRLFQIRQNVKPKNGTWRGWNSFGAQKRFKRGWFVDPLLCPAGAGCLSPPLHQNCRRCHLPLLRNCAEIELGSFFLRGALLSSQFLRSRRNLMSCMAGIVFMRLRSVFLDEQTSFCRHLKGERLIE